MQKKFSVIEPLHIWCISIWLVAAVGAIMVIAGFDTIADNDVNYPYLNQYENVNVVGVFLVNLSYISIWSFSFAYYRASTLLQMENKYNSNIELTNFLQNQDKKDKIYNIVTISLIVVLSAF